jgi:tight adherence protein C
MWMLALSSGGVAAAAAHRLVRTVRPPPGRAGAPTVAAVPSGRQLPRGPILVVALVLSAVVLGAVPTVGSGCALAGSWVAVRRKAEIRRRRERDDAVPDLVDLFVLAASAGLPVATALPIVAARAPAPLAAALTRSVGRMGRGGSAAEALDELRAALGPRASPLLDALDSASRVGTPLAPALAAVAVAAHHQRSQAAEEAARRLPVTLLFPLACCILPAAMLLALVPVLVASLGSLAI